MDQIIAFCGLDCSGCEAYQATLAEDDAAKLEIWEQWKVTYNSPDMPFEAVTCDSCTAGVRTGGYCADCPVRACGMARGLANCAHCEDYETCGTLQSFIADIEDARENLAAIRVVL
ncbi:MAG: DUF3795 domain-containing protein [Brevefilum sp.]